MLLELQIRDFALINKLNLEFNKGLNILTGETGAGKSIIIDSVNFVLGERTSKDIIRNGTERTEVQAVFENIKTPEFLQLINEYGICLDENVVILSRELNTSGRNICRVNGKVVTTSTLKNIGNFLIDIHGQHEHQSLLNEDYHIDVLDMFGSSTIHELKNEVFRYFRAVQEINHTLSTIMGDDIERDRKLNFLIYQINEIDEAALKQNEEELLARQRNVLLNSEKLYSVFSSVLNALYESDDNNQSVYDKLGYILSELRGIIGLDDKISAISKNIEDSYYIIESSISDIRDYRDKIDFNTELINEVELRLDLINKLKRKYGRTVQDILNYREAICEEKSDIENSEEKIKKLKKQFEENLSILSTKSSDLSELRKKTADKLINSIIKELAFLGMDKSKFKVQFEVINKDGHVSYNEKGMDIVRFLISTNPGEPEKPLSKIASGGEISRIMLAIKAVMADTDKIPSLIFDEIDTGISGIAAQAVAEKLRDISSNHQVICVTHLPQIASMADTHFYISKSTVSNKTTTHVVKLGYDAEIKEIARMLGGTKLTDLTLKHAEEMISLAKNDRY